MKKPLIINILSMLASPGFYEMIKKHQKGGEVGMFGLLWYNLKL